MIADPNGIDFGTKTYRFGHFSGPSYRGAHAGWPAALLGGQLGFLETYVNQGARAFCLHVNRRPHSQPGAHAGWPAVLLGGQLGFLEAYVNQGARAFCLHVNRRPHSQPANTPSARLGTFETRVNRAHGHADLHVKGEFRPPQRGPPQGPRGPSFYPFVYRWTNDWCLGREEGTKCTRGPEHLGPPMDDVPSKKGRTCVFIVCFTCKQSAQAGAPIYV